MNLPNRLTIARLFLTAGFVASMTLAWQKPEAHVLSWSWGYTAGLVFFVAASVTDYFDGAIARKHNLVTDFGKLMDPLADKVLMAAAFICLIPEYAIPAWAAIVIISREFLITGLRLLASAKGKVLPADRMGKHKTAWQMVTGHLFPDPPLAAGIRAGRDHSQQPGVLVGACLPLRRRRAHRPRAGPHAVFRRRLPVEEPHAARHGLTLKTEDRI